MVIRRAAADDADALSDLAHRAKAHWGYPANWMRRWDAQLTILPGYLEMHDVWVAEEAGAIVGMCALEDQRDRWHLEHVWVEPSPLVAVPAPVTVASGAGPEPSRRRRTMSTAVPPLPIRPSA